MIQSPHKSVDKNVVKGVCRSEPERLQQEVLNSCQQDCILEKQLLESVFTVITGIVWRKCMKTVIINGSPRKNWNTAQLLKEAKRGAEEAGHETSFVNLYDLKFTGCKSCLGCKRAGIAEPCKCYIKDELSPVLDEIYESDHLIIGSPIYFSQPTGEVRCLLERVCFPPLCYNDYSSNYKRKTDVTVFLTMNAPADMYGNTYQAGVEAYFEPFHFLNGKVEIIPVCDTLQANDYSKYEMKSFSEEHKKAVRETEFPKALQKAYESGKNN